jgi:hypothetical protein
MLTKKEAKVESKLILSISSALQPPKYEAIKRALKLIVDSHNDAVDKIDRLETEIHNTNDFIHGMLVRNKEIRMDLEESNKKLKELVELLPKGQIY